MTRLTRTDLLNWADTKASEGLLPELIRRLIIVSGHTLETIVMPYGDSVGRSGLDGFVRVEKASAYIPEGESVWELGTNKDHISKANQDFEKRTLGTTESRQRELYYCFITPRHWEKKSKWESNPGSTTKQIDNHWKKVRVYDVDDLLGWLSDCPSVEAWFSRKLGKATAGLRDVHGYWENVQSTVPLSPEVLLAGREELTEIVQKHLSKDNQTPMPLGLISRSPAEIVPFSVACIVASDLEAGKASTLVVDSRNRWEQVIVEETNLGLIVSPQVQPSREEIQQAYRNGHRVIYCSLDGKTSLPRLSEYDLCKALISSGVEESKAVQHAKQCGGNGQILLDRLSGLGTPAINIGSNLDDRVKVACLLLVGWNGKHSADRDIFSILCGIPYSDIEASLVSDSNAPDGLLFRADGKFRLLSPELAWTRYAKLITKRVIETFTDIVRYLLADDDPTAELSGSERLTAQFQGKRPEFSRTLRQNVVHSLAIAGALGSSKLNLDSSMNPSFVDWIVKSTLKDATFNRWASFGSELSILAEAAPDAFLDALEPNLHPGGPLEKVMEHSKTNLFSSGSHVGILWALERLCWSPNYLERATSVLLRLSALNSQINSGNNPTNSIRETLQVYCPQTNADWSVRQQTIKRMLDEDRETSFDIIISLLPSGHSTWIHRQTPVWRDWAYGYQKVKTWDRIATEVHWCIEELILAATDTADRWCKLLELCGNIEDSQYHEILGKIEGKLSDNKFTDESKRHLWETINAILIRLKWTSSRRRLSNGDVVDESEIKDSKVESQPHFPKEMHRLKQFGSKLKELLEAATPEDQVLAASHAFLNGKGTNHCARHFSDRFDWQEQQRQIDDSRKKFVNTIINSSGLSGLRRLAGIEHVDANAVGRVAASQDECKIPIEDILQLFNSGENSDQLLVKGFIAAWAWKLKDSLRSDVFPLLKKISSENTKAAIMQCLPPGKEIWNFVDNLSESLRKMYWKEAPIPWEIEEESIGYLVKNLVYAGRADRGIELLSRLSNKLTEVERISIFEALEALPLIDLSATGWGENSNLHWEIQKLLKVLYDFELSQDQQYRLVSIELLYHDVFEKDEDLYFQPVGLLTTIRDSPYFFVDLLTYPWKNDSGNSVTLELQGDDAIANHVASLLWKLGEIPGQSDLCPLREITISQWLAEVIRIATERCYLTAVQLQMSSILTSRAWNDINSWPSIEVVEVINMLAEIDPDDFRNELSSGLFNARGVHFVDPTGQSELEAAEQLHSRSEQILSSCPAAAWALRNVAQSLESESRRNVERANWRK